MKECFEKLKRINNNYKTTIDALSVEHETDAARDARYSDELIAQRVAERNARFNAEIDKAAQEAVDKAAPEFAKLRAKLRAYITDTADLATVQTLSALISAGVALSEGEMEAYAQKGGYNALRLLEKPSGGRIQAPKLDAMEQDLKSLEAHFRNLRAYRGGMAGANTERFWGQSATVGSVIQQGMIDKFHEKVDGIAAQWSSID